MPAVFLLHLSKQVTQGCNREMTPKKTVFSNYFVNKTQNLMAKLSWSKQVNVPVFILHPGKQVTQGCNREITPKKPYFSNNFVHETQNLIAKQSQNRQMNASLLLLHPGKQITQDCNWKITPKNPNSVIILLMKLKTQWQINHKTGKWMPHSFYCIQVNRSPKIATERLLQKT